MALIQPFFQPDVTPDTPLFATFLNGFMERRTRDNLMVMTRLLDNQDSKFINEHIKMIRENRQDLIKLKGQIQKEQVIGKKEVLKSIIAAKADIAVSQNNFAGKRLDAFKALGVAYVGTKENYAEDLKQRKDDLKNLTLVVEDETTREELIKVMQTGGGEVGGVPAINRLVKKIESGTVFGAMENQAFKDTDRRNNLLSETFTALLKDAKTAGKARTYFSTSTGKKTLHLAMKMIDPTTKFDWKEHNVRTDGAIDEKEMDRMLSKSLGELHENKKATFETYTKASHKRTDFKYKTAVAMVNALPQMMDRSKKIGRAKQDLKNAEEMEDLYRKKIPGQKPKKPYGAWVLGKAKVVKKFSDKDIRITSTLGQNLNYKQFQSAKARKKKEIANLLHEQKKQRTFVQKGTGLNANALKRLVKKVYPEVGKGKDIIGAIDKEIASLGSQLKGYGIVQADIAKERMKEGPGRMFKPFRKNYLLESAFKVESPKSKTIRQTLEYTTKRQITKPSTRRSKFYKNLQLGRPYSLAGVPNLSVGVTEIGGREKPFIVKQSGVYQVVPEAESEYRNLLKVLKDINDQY